MMDSRSQNDSDGGGGRHGTSHDEGRPLQTHDGPAGPWSSQAVLALDLIRITGSSNEYTEGPVVGQRSPASQQKNEVSRSGSQQDTQGETQSGSLLSGRVRLSTTEDSQSSVRTSVGSVSSTQRLLGGTAGGEEIIRTQPKRAEGSSEELKVLNEDMRTVVAMPGSIAAAATAKCSHARSKCEDCGRCRCAECTHPRVLPSCWMCGRRCVCSAQSAVEHCTCVCCVKALFYHCSSDDEDTCADKPFSCTQTHCCARWTTISVLATFLPCLLCYLPAKGCVAACQCCYDRVTRPGCRCNNTPPTHSITLGKSP